MNKKSAQRKLNAILNQMEADEKDRQNNLAWSEHTKIVRGNPIRVYEGMEFKLKRNEKGGRK